MKPTTNKMEFLQVTVFDLEVVPVMISGHWASSLTAGFQGGSVLVDNLCYKNTRKHA